MIADALKFLLGLLSVFTGWRERRAAAQAKREAQAPIEAALMQAQDANEALTNSMEYEQRRVNAPVDYVKRGDLDSQ